jgi:polyhydroxybutyrate depolymerase
MRRAVTPAALSLAAAILLALAASAPRLATPPAASAAVCSPIPHASGTFSRTITSGGIQRTYELHVPPSYDGATPLPLVLNFHGLGSNIFEEVFLSDLYPRSDAQGFLVATPQGLSTAALPQNHWNNVNLAPGSEADDVLFASNVINDVATQLCLDVSGVYSTGMSNGAQMSTRLACSLSSRIAAVAPVAGFYYPPMSTTFIPDESCPDTRPVPIIAFHGTGDGTIPFNGGAGALGIVFRDIDDVVLPAWATHNACATGPSTSLAAPGVNLIRYTDCAGDADLDLYVVFDYDGEGPATTGGSHSWPGSPYMPSGSTQAIDATDLMLAFFAQHTLPCAAGDGDCDSVLDAADNCLSDYNPGQQNADANMVDLPSTKAFDDLTRPNSDVLGDACDNDDDNDGRSDADEIAGMNCGIFTSPTDSRDGDSDGDLFLDSAECLLGFNPSDIDSRPSMANCQAAAPGDADADGLPGFREFCNYGTSDSSANTDGDACGDAREIASVNGDQTVNAIDLGQVAAAFGPSTSGIYIADFDFTRDLSINAIDLGLVAQRFGPCP